jgi:hypothetical protein
MSATVPEPKSICSSFADNIDNYKTTTIRQTQHYIGIDNLEETTFLYPSLQRSPFIPPVQTQLQLVDAIQLLDCVAKVDYINPYVTIVWVNIQTLSDFDSRPFTMRTGIFGTRDIHYPVPVPIADEIVGSVVFNLHLKIVSIDRAIYSFTHYGKTYIPYIINFSP